MGRLGIDDLLVFLSGILLLGIIRSGSTGQRADAQENQGGDGTTIKHGKLLSKHNVRKTALTPNAFGVKAFRQDPLGYFDDYHLPGDRNRDIGLWSNTAKFSASPGHLFWHPLPATSRAPGRG
jgi:hypothetical protein